MITNNLFIAQQCDQVCEVALLEECIASGQVSASQVESHRVAGDTVAEHDRPGNAIVYDDARRSAVALLASLGYSYHGNGRWTSAFAVQA